jgi:hypothetical protein
MMEWISVEEDLPKGKFHFVQVVKMIDGRKVRVPITAILKDGLWRGIYWYGSHELEGITHWRDLSE